MSDGGAAPSFFAILEGNVPVRLEGLGTGFRAYLDGHETLIAGGRIESGPGDRRLRIEHFTILPIERDVTVPLDGSLVVPLTPVATGRLSQSWPSLLLPGAAQQLQERPGAASLFGGAFLAAGLSAVHFHAKANAAAAAYGGLPATASPDQQALYRGRIARGDAVASALLLVTGAVWAAAFGEAYYRAPRY